MKKNLFLITLTLLGKLAFAQTITYNWNASAGSSSNDLSKAVVTDNNGNVYVTGSYSGTVDFDPGSGTTYLTSSGADDIFVQKLNSGGSLVWVKNIGGSQQDYANDITIDAEGNLFITGGFTGLADFDPSSSTFEMTSVPDYTEGLKVKVSDRSDAFILKLDNSGGFIWAKQVGASGPDFGISLVADHSGNVIITGEYSNYNTTGPDTCDFDPGTGKYLLINGGMYVLKLDINGDFVWACQIGKYRGASSIGSGTDWMVTSKSYYVVANALQIDAKNNVYITGTFTNTTDFNPGSGTYNITPPGYSGFALKLDSNSNFVFAKAFGSSGAICQSSALGLDNSGNIYLTGYFKGIVDFDPSSSTYNITSTSYVKTKGTNNPSDAFVLKLSNTGSFVWVKQLGGSGDDAGNAIAVGSDGGVYTTGYFNGKSDFNPASGKSTYYLTSNGTTDIYVSKLNNSGNFVYAKQIGGTGDDAGLDLALTESQDIGIHTCGYYSGTVDMDPGTGTVNISSIGGRDAFAHKMTESGSEHYTANVNDLNNEGIQFLIYPNPTQGVTKLVLNQNSDDVNIKIFNAFGQLLYTEQANTIKELTLDFSNYPSGVYFVEIKNSEGSTKVKVIKSE